VLLSPGSAGPTFRHAAFRPIPAALSGRPTPEIDTMVSQSARIWNYWLGRNDNYAAGSLAVR
jgi:hypothetical protein